MPRLPSAETMGERPVASPVKVAPGYRGATGAETLPGESVMRLGGAAERAGNVVYQAETEHQEKLDRSAAESAFNSYREKQMELTLAEGKGFVHRKGAQVMDKGFFPSYMSQINNSFNEANTGLANDRQRELFKSRAGIADLQFKENILRHITEQENQHAKQTVAAGLDLEQKVSGYAWRDPNAIRTSLVRSEGLLKDMAEREGWSPEVMNNKRIEQRTRIHTAVISNALANDQWQYAQTWYDKNKADIADPDGRITRALEEGGLRTRSQAAADKISTQYRDVPEALEAARKISDPKVRDATEDRLRRIYADRKQNDIRLRNALFLDNARTVEATGDVDRIDPAKYAEMGPEQRAALKMLADRKRSGIEVKQNDEVFLKFTELAPGALARMDEAELIQKYKPHVDAEHWNIVSKRWEAARNAAMGQPEGAVKIKDDLTFEQRFVDTMKSSGLIPKDKTLGALKGDNAAMVAKLRQAAANDLLAYKRSTGKDYVPPEEVQRIINRHVMRTAFTDNPWWGDRSVFGGTERPITLMTPEEKEKAYVPIKKIPADDIVKIKNYARKQGVNITNNQLERAYFIYQSGGSVEEYNRAIRGGR